MIKLDRICREANVMLIFARSYGLTGLVRISLKVLNLKYMELSLLIIIFFLGGCGVEGGLVKVINPSAN